MIYLKFVFEKNQQRCSFSNGDEFAEDIVKMFEYFKDNDLEYPMINILATSETAKYLFETLLLHNETDMDFKLDCDTFFYELESLFENGSVVEIGILDDGTVFFDDTRYFENTLKDMGTNKEFFVYVEDDVDDTWKSIVSKYGGNSLTFNFV